MVKHIVIGISLLVFGLWIATGLKPQVSASEISISPSREREYKGSPYTGEVVSYYANGKIKSTDEFVDGRRSGYSKKWFKDGVLAYESFHQKGAREGYTRSWWFNGNLKSKTFYKNGKSNGEAWLWYRNGNKFKRFNFIDGQPVGLQQAWRLNGKLFSNFDYKNGRIFGLRKSNNCVGLEDEKISVDYYRLQAGSI